MDALYPFRFRSSLGISIRVSIRIIKLLTLSVVEVRPLEVFVVLYQNILLVQSLQLLQFVGIFFPSIYGDRQISR